MTATITFLGAAETVTGSRYLIEAGQAKVLVDCGLFQGYKKLRVRNWGAPSFDVASLDAVVLTHAHLDHSGYLPRLTNLGFTGPVYCTHGTSELLRILLPDAGYLQEEDARRANKYGYSRHHPAMPLYTRAEAERSLERLVVRPFAREFDVAKGVTATFSRAGHILGSACVTLRVAGTTVTFTGDVGRPLDAIMHPPAPLGPTDYLITESTYGDRKHPAEDAAGVVGDIVRETAERGGVVLVPAFAVGRAQHLLYILSQLKAAGKIPDLPVFLDSPMAISATDVFRDSTGDHRLSEAECRALFEVTRYSRTPDDSKAIDARSEPMIVISASGMATGGRILHHLARFLPDARNTVLIVGYQAAGTRGRSLLDGVDELKIHGRYVPVRARVRQVEGLSAHADYQELIEWFSASSIRPRRVFVTHGEPGAVDAFRRRLRDTFGWDVVDPDDGSRWVLAGGAGASDQTSP